MVNLFMGLAVGWTMKLAESLKNVVIAILIGIFMMMPGVSGATLAVIFGIYDRIIRDISQPTKYLREDLGFILTLVIVGIIGVFICVKGFDYLIDRYEIPLMFFFGTAVLLQLPDIWKQAGDGRKATPFNYLALAVGFVLMILVPYISMVTFDWGESPGPLVMAVAGVIYGICLLSPGISGSTVLLALGLFTIMIESLSNLDFAAILPLIIGAAIGILLFAKVVDHFVTHYRKSTYFAIIGLTAGSIVAVVAQAITRIESSDQILQCIVAIALGVILGWCTHMFSKKYVVPQGSESERSVTIAGRG
jgi:putative membrane protein